MSRLKSLFVTAWYPTKDQTVEGVFVREHAKAVQLYDDVMVLHCGGPDARIKGCWRIEHEPDECLADGIQTYHVWHRRLPIPNTSYFLSIWSLLQAYRYIVRRGFHPDVIHAHVYKAGAPSALIGKLMRVPVVVTEQSTEFPRKLLKRRDIIKARQAFEGARVVMPVSRALQHAIEAYGIHAKFRVIPNVVDPELFYPCWPPRAANGLKQLLTVCLLDPSHKKGIPQLLQALSILRRERQDWHYWIVGDGPARGEYERLAVELGLSESLTFCGLRPKTEVAEFMRRADLFVLPSIWDNLPCVLIEAMASGLPIVSTEAGGIPEIVDKDVGMLVPPDDPERLSGALSRMIAGVHEYDRQMIARRADRFSRKSVGALIHSVYEECVRR